MCSHTETNLSKTRNAFCVRTAVPCNMNPHQQFCEQFMPLDDAGQLTLDSGSVCGRCSGSCKKYNKRRYYQLMISTISRHHPPTLWGVWISHWGKLAPRVGNYYRFGGVKWGNALWVGCLMKHVTQAVFCEKLIKFSLEWYMAIYLLR